MTLKIPPTLKPLARAARASGWTITYTGKGHLRWRSPGGHVVYTGSTPQQYGHAVTNARHQLRKAGLTLTERHT